jgi:membrane protein
MSGLAETALDLGRRSFERFVELEGFDRAMALAGQMFAALMPLLIVVAAVSPGGGKDLADGLIDRMDLTGDSAQVLKAVVAPPSAVRNSISVVGAFLLVISALSFTRALQRLYVRAWRLPTLGMTGNAWGLMWLAAYAVYWSLQPLVVGLFNGVTASAVTVALSAVLWLYTPWLLVGRRIPWRRLVGQALLTAFGIAALTVAALVYGPRAIGSAATQFGFIGVAFALLTLLFFACLVAVVAAAVGATLAEPLARADDAERRRRAAPV